MFGNDAPGTLVEIRGSDPMLGSWEHRAFVPNPMSDEMPPLQPPTYLAIADTRASLAALDNTARRLPDPTLLRSPSLRLEAQSTSALEGTYAPLADVLIADEDDDEPPTIELVEILNYVRAAQGAFRWVGEGRPITAGFLSDLQGSLMRGTALADVSGRLRESQVVIGRRPGADPSGFPIHNAQFVPPPPGPQLITGVQQLTDWLTADHHGRIDPVVAAAMSHYQFETLHPFRDGNGRIGRLLIVLHLQALGVLSEPTLTVSPWFEARRGAYYDALFAVSAQGRWDAWIRFFAEGLRASADSTHRAMLELVDVQEELKQVVRSSPLRADSAQALVDLAVANPTFTVRQVQRELSLSYGRANKLVGQLVDLGVVSVVNPDAYKRRFYARRVLEVLTTRSRT